MIETIKISERLVDKGEKNQYTPVYTVEQKKEAETKEESDKIRANLDFYLEIISKSTGCRSSFYRQITIADEQAIVLDGGWVEYKVKVKPDLG
jgi:citrate synthase